MPAGVAVTTRADPVAEDGRRGFLAYVLQDWSANPANPKVRLALAWFRLTQRIAAWPKPLYWLGVPVLVLYRVVVDWVLGIELHWSTRVGPGLRLHHAHPLVINPLSVIGASCHLRHCTTLGTREERDGSSSAGPVLGDRVDVGPHVVILGAVHVGDDAVIGAGSVVLRDVPAGAVVAGNPARILRLPDGVEPGTGDAADREPTDASGATPTGVPRAHG